MSNTTLKATFSTSLSEGATPVEANVEYDFTGVSNAELMALAERALRVRLQAQWRRGAKGVPSAFQRIVQEATSKPVSVRALIDAARNGGVDPRTKAVRNVIRAMLKAGMTDDVIVDVMKAQHTYMEEEVKSALAYVHSLKSKEKGKSKEK